MFVVKQLVPKFATVYRAPRAFRFNTVQMKPRNLAPHQDRASFIAMLLNQGKTYQFAVREYDKKVRQNAKR